MIVTRVVNVIVVVTILMIDIAAELRMMYNTYEVYHWGHR